ncbi:methyl-accepting chemotaxis protein [Sporobacter termitidis DSM 10068]|uniref:Methyl-accepting chemotaxis protein n=1 Tax=Sporobacter termitidis DSM 10068 TaxID=1123282 RepID=A0A1M5YW63_9FIRM|nr:methyl-accepting chemotaxis protein [Sporobacter termitidis]SHI16297.1 methyl-accepting chemotaxis protein [Sporobacter termitidis DSM 10068]
MKTWFANLKIARKLMLGFLMVTILGIIVGVVGIINVSSLSQSQQATYNECTMGILYSEQAKSAFLDIRVAIRDMYINYGLDKTQYYDRIAADQKTIDDLLSQYGQGLSTDEDRQIFGTMQTSYEAYKGVIDELVDTAKSDKPGMIFLRTLENSQEVANSASEGFEAVAQYNQRMASEQIARDMASARLATYVLIGVLVASAALALVISTVISGGISRPMQKFAAFAKLLADGDMEVDKVIGEKEKLLYLRKDEVGVLAASFDKVIASTLELTEKTKAVAEGDLTVEMTVRSEADVLGMALTDLVEKFHMLTSSIITAADQVASGAELVSNSSLELSQGATEQASSVQQLTASLEQVASQTQMNARSAEEANGYSKEAKKEAESGNRQMADMLRAMDEINISSSSINKIIKVIDDIAFQTNILALNAAVEAARAGQYGKGFAVVAEEVRTLAAKSAQAAKETTDLIEGSIHKVETGTKIANETADVLARIVAQVSKVADLIEGITAASDEQAAAIEQINQGVQQVSQVVQSNAATSEESAAASEELSSQAAALKESVSVFKIRLGHSAPPADDEDAAIPVRLAAVSAGGTEFGKY